jgi:hypothetical protein
MLFDGLTAWFLSLVAAWKKQQLVQQNTQEQAIQENGQMDNIIQCHHLSNSLVLQLSEGSHKS